MKVALKFAYIGFYFHGYARQPNVPTVEGTLIQKLLDTQIISDINSAQIRCASRTDKHVSALSNVITFSTTKSPKKILFSLADEFESVFPYGVKEVGNDFNPRYALKRTYQYLLPRHIFEIETLDYVLTFFEGEHNFSNFARVESHRNPIRSIDTIEVFEKSEFIIVEISAQTFLWNQIRRIIEAGIKYCNNKLTIEQIQKALSQPEKPVVFNIAPAIPLILTKIDYPTLTFFEPDLLKKEKGKVMDNVKQQVTNLDF